jgi:hypothetical protein
MLERKDLQLVIHEFLKQNHIKWITRENNQRQQKYRHCATKKYDGIPDDVIFLRNGTVLFFEYKVGNNKLRPAQIEWRDYLVNYKWHEIRDIETAINIIKENM